MELGRSGRPMMRPLLRPLFSNATYGVDAANTPDRTPLR